MAFDCAEPNPEAEERLCSCVPRMCVHVLGTQSVPVGKEGSYTCGELLWGMSGNEDPLRFVNLRRVSQGLLVPGLCPCVRAWPAV
jgi:hypothetical protein